MFKVTDLKNLEDSIIGEFDLFVCFNSFEERCTSIASHIPVDRFLRILIFTNEIELENQDANLQKMVGIFCGKEEVVRLDLASPVNITDKIVDQLNKINLTHPIKRVFIDITTFTHETLLILLAVFKEKFNEAEIICGYNNAKEYSTDKESIETKWLSRGIGDVRSVLGYSGDVKPSQENLLMVIVGYEYERAARIIDAISPDHLIIGYNVANNATTEKNRNANEGYVGLLKKMSPYFEQMIDFVVPSDNPYEAYHAICERIDAIGNGVNVIIVPMNNKLSTLGVALVGLTRPEVQICYAPALVYNTSSYSAPGDSCYIFSFDWTEINEGI